MFDHQILRAGILELNQLCLDFEQCVAAGQVPVITTQKELLDKRIAEIANLRLNAQLDEKIKKELGELQATLGLISPLLTSKITYDNLLQLVPHFAQIAIRIKAVQNLLPAEKPKVVSLPDNPLDFHANALAVIEEALVKGINKENANQVVAALKFLNSEDQFLKDQILYALAQWCFESGEYEKMADYTTQMSNDLLKTQFYESNEEQFQKLIKELSSQENYVRAVYLSTFLKPKLKQESINTIPPEKLEALLKLCLETQNYKNALAIVSAKGDYPNKDSDLTTIILSASNAEQYDLVQEALNCASPTLKKQLSDYAMPSLTAVSDDENDDTVVVMKSEGYSNVVAANGVAPTESDNKHRHATHPKPKPKKDVPPPYTQYSADKKDGT